jgi:hypothetical protein
MLPSGEKAMAFGAIELEQVPPLPLVQMVLVTLR